MKPSAIDATQTSHDSLPTVAATAPIENRTNGGTPLATQNAPVQSMPRSRPGAERSAAVVLVVSASPALLKLSPRCGARAVRAAGLLPGRFDGWPVRNDGAAPPRPRRC